MEQGQQFKKFFHGTAHEFSPGEILKPNAPLHGPSTGSHVYLTDQHTAREYAAMAMEQLQDLGRLTPQHSPRVYEAQPLGPVEEDPAGLRNDDGTTDDVRTTHARIIRQVYP